MQKKVDEKPQAAPEPEALKAPVPKEPAAPPKQMCVIGVNAATGQAVFEEVKE